MSHAITLEEFVGRLEEGDRWIEVQRGQLVRLEPPTELHGNVVRNVARLLARHIQQKKLPAYAVFELGLVVDRSPLTISCPAISCYVGDGSFRESERLVSDVCPTLVVEVASTNERREAAAERVQQYFNWGARSVWLFDTLTRHAHVFRESRFQGRMLKEDQQLEDERVFPELRFAVAEVFADPAWA